MPIKSFDIYSYKNVYKFQVIDALSKLVDILNEGEYSVIFVDSVVLQKYQTFFENINIKKIVVEVSAKTKSIEQLPVYLEKFSNLSLKKNSSIVVVGGATMQDMFGTVCCLYFRGIKWTFIPTTLLSQGDSCIGSKTSLDGFGKKNQFGVFYPPSKIYISSIFLDSLPSKEIYSGIGDILHYLLPYDEEHKIIKDLLNLSSTKDKKKLLSFCVHISSLAMKIKSELVKIDEFDEGPRKIFNYGHTFGHALEKASSNYLPHGLAVLCGLFVALNLKKQSSIMSFCADQRNLLKDLIEIMFCAEKINIEIDFSKLHNLLESDKKNVIQGKVKVVLPTELSKSLWICESMNPIYGLNLFDLDVDECVKSFICLSEIKGITFN